MKVLLVILNAPVREYLQKALFREKIPFVSFKSSYSKFRNYAKEFSIVVTDDPEFASSISYSLKLSDTLLVFVGKEHPNADVILPPSPETVFNFIRKVYLLGKMKNSSQPSDEIPEGFSENDFLLYQVLKSHPSGVSSGTLSYLLGWSNEKIRYYVYRLRQKGFEIEYERGKYKLITYGLR